MNALKQIVQGKDEQREIPIEFLRPTPGQPREQITQQELEELAATIERMGLIQPVVVRRNPDDKTGRTYFIISGERRWRACQMARVHMVQCIVKDVEPAVAYIMAVTENTARVGLNAVETAVAFKRVEDILLALGEAKVQESIANYVGASRTAVTNHIRVATLSEAALNLARAHPTVVKTGHLIPLVGLSQEQQLALLQDCIDNKRTARAMERAAARLKVETKKKQQAEALTPEEQMTIAVKSMETKVAETIGAKVEIDHSAKGKYVVSATFHSLEEMEGYFERLGLRREEDE